MKPANISSQVLHERRKCDSLYAYKNAKDAWVRRVEISQRNTSACAHALEYISDIIAESLQIGLDEAQT